MRFIMIFVQICKGIYRGIRFEVNQLAKQARLNELQKQKNKELLLEYQRLGEYVYFCKEKVDEVRVEQLYIAIEELLEEINRCEQEIRGGE